MTELYRPKIELLAGSADESYGKFVVEPLERGFGVTLGNALRRILLSFIQGLAFTSVRIEGVVHEFSTIPGVYEDTTELLLNLKEAFLRPVVDDVASANLPEDEVWTATIDADFAFRSLKLPPGDQPDLAGQFQERMLAIETFLQAYFELYERFLALRSNPAEWSLCLNGIRAWVANLAGI